MGNVNNVFRGPVTSVYLGTTQLGYVGGGANLTITFEPQVYEENAGNGIQLFGRASWTLEIVETDSGMIASASASALTETALTASDLKGNTYTIEPTLVNYTVNRGFGDDPHIITLKGTLKVLNESDFVTIS